jgi:pimeloyl-ACP methyl ester carboxylesterase
MPVVHANDADLHYERQGSGPPLVLVHGSWGDATNWMLVAPMLSESFDVVTYSRRGHGESSAPTGQGSRSQDEDDLVGLIEALDIAPANVAGNSFGASITLGAASRYPEVFARISGHEPPLLGLVEDPGVQHLVDEQRKEMAAALAHLEAGRNAEGAEYFIENVAFGAGAWQQLPEPVRERFIRHAPTWLDEQRDPAWDELDLDALASYPGRILLTQGGQSLEWFWKVIDRIEQRVPKVERKTFPDAGHVPQMTNPDHLAAALPPYFLD